MSNPTDEQLAFKVAKLAGVVGMRPCNHCNGHGGTYYDGGKEFVQDCHHCNYTGMTCINLLALENLHLLKEAVWEWCESEQPEHYWYETYSCIHFTEVNFKAYSFKGDCICDKSVRNESESRALALAWLQAAGELEGE